MDERKSLQKNFARSPADLQEVGFKASFVSGLLMPLVHGFSNIAYVVVALLAGFKVLAGKLTVGNMQAFVQYVWADFSACPNLDPVGLSVTVCQIFP